MRQTWDAYFIEVAEVVATRGTCKRKNVGVVIVKNNIILSTGYNGSPKGFDHCIDVGCDIKDDHCIRSVHAEINAIVQSAKNGVAIDGATIYTTASPCWPCMKAIINSGIKKIVYLEFYRDDTVFKAAAQSGIHLCKFNEG